MSVADHSLRDYRRFTVHEVELNYSFHFRLRKESPETFESRWVILRYGRWLILSVSWFQPDKQKKKRNKKSHTYNRLIITPKSIQTEGSSVRFFRRLNSIASMSTVSPVLARRSYVF